MSNNSFDKITSVRIPESMLIALRRLFPLLTFSSIVRICLDDYIKRNGGYENGKN